jgi:hypothetical protein
LNTILFCWEFFLNRQLVANQSIYNLTGKRKRLSKSTFAIPGEFKIGPMTGTLRRKATTMGKKFLGWSARYQLKNVPEQIHEPKEFNNHTKEGPPTKNYENTR